MDHNGIHTWAARFFRSGALAFWYCIECGATDREIDDLAGELEDLSGEAEAPLVTITGPEPVSAREEWSLPDGSVLVRGEPCSASFRGYPIPALPETSSFTLVSGSGGERREFTPRYERSSTIEDCYILTRYRVVEDRLVKFRIHCCDYSDGRPVRIDEPNGNTILSGLRRLD